MNAWLGVPIVAALLVARCGWRVGAWLLRKLDFAGDAERMVFSMGAGLAALSLALFFVGLCGGIYRWPLWAAVAAIALTGRWGRPSWKWLLPLLVLGYVGQLALFPPTASDALLYHLPHAKAYTVSHHLRPPWNLRWAVLPLLGEMLLTLQFALSGELAAQLNQLLMLALICGALYAWGARWFSPAMGALAAAAFAGNPLAVYLGTSAYTDLTLTLYCTLALYALAAWRDDRRFIWVAGAFAGCAAACKYTGLFTVALGAVVVLESRRWADARRYFLACAAVTVPFYGYIVYHTGNPLWPFASHIFGYVSWNALDVSAQVDQLHRSGVARTLGEFLRLPWTLAVANYPFAFEADPSPFCLVALPLMLVAAWASPRVRVLLYGVLAYLLLWFATAQFGRYLTPFMPLLHLAAAGSIAWLLDRAPRVRAGFARPLVLALACAVVLSPGLHYAREMADWQGEIPRNRAARVQFLSRNIPGYRLVAQLNDKAGKDYSLYCFECAMALFTEGRHVGDWFGPARMPDLWPAFYPQNWCTPQSSQRLMRVMQNTGADHLMISRQYLQPDYDDCMWFHAHFRARFQDAHWVLFQVFRDAK